MTRSLAYSGTLTIVDRLARVDRASSIADNMPDNCSLNETVAGCSG